jgi:hypothetical protein
MLARKLRFCKNKIIENTYGIQKVCCKSHKALQLASKSACSHPVLCAFNASVRLYELKLLHAHHHTTARVRDDVLTFH